MSNKLKIKQIAEKYGRDRSTVLRWIEAGLFPQAKFEETPFGYIWLVPEESLIDFTLPEMGRKKKEKRAA